MGSADLKILEILPVLTGVKKVGTGWKARCPSHDDSNPSLSLTEKNGKALLFCHAGCSYQDILTAAGFWNDAGITRVSLTNGKRSANSISKRHVTENKLATVYDYVDESGQLLYQIVRRELLYDDGTRGKAFSARRRPKAGETPSADGWQYDVKGISLVPYNLPAVRDAALVYLVEGEKDVDSLRKIGLPATCNPFGAGKWRDEFSPHLRDKTVVILPDNDAVGREHAEKVANSLQGIAAEVLIIDLPNLKEGGDITNFLERGGTADDLMDLVQRAEHWCQPKERTNEPKTSGFVFTSLDKLLGEPAEDVSFIWDSTLPTGGFSICSAKPKVGKSTLARNLAVAVATGTGFLGRETVNGKVLYLCLEEKRSEIRNHFEKMGVSSDQVLIHTGSTPKDPVVELALAIAETKPALVIIDPLSRVIRVPDFNDYGSMARGLEPLIDLARQTGCHILALHHDSKMERNGGDAILGSTALFGAADCHIHLKKRDKGRTISTTQRYGEDMPETVIDLDKATLRISALGDLQTISQELAQTAIIESIGDNESLDETAIKSRIEGYSKGVLSKALRVLLEQGRLDRTGEGKRGNPFLYSKPSTWVN